MITVKWYKDLMVDRDKARGNVPIVAIPGEPRSIVALVKQEHADLVVNAPDMRDVIEDLLEAFAEDCRHTAHGLDGQKNHEDFMRCARCQSRIQAKRVLARTRGEQP